MEEITILGLLVCLEENQKGMPLFSSAFKSIENFQKKEFFVKIVLFVFVFLRCAYTTVPLSILFHMPQVQDYSIRITNDLSDVITRIAKSKLGFRTCVSPFMCLENALYLHCSRAKFFI